MFKNSNTSIPRYRTYKNASIHGAAKTSQNIVQTIELSIDEGESIDKELLHFEDGRCMFRSKKVEFTLDSVGNILIFIPMNLDLFPLEVQTLIEP